MKNKLKTTRKNRLTKAEHVKINWAKDGNKLNEIMIKLENKYGLRKPNMGK